MSQQDSGPNQPSSGVISVGRAGLANVDFRKAKFDKFQLAFANFVACDFRGLPLGERFAPFFTTRPRSVFTSCKFDGADLRQISPEGTRFEKCSFEDAKLDGWTPARAEFVECRFAGKVVKVTFTGKPAGPGSARIDPARATNEFRGNDFRDAELIDTVFVLGIDLKLQRWPVGDDYVRLDKFLRRVERARADVLTWDAGEARTEALTMLQGLTKRWQDQREIIALRISPAAGAAPRVQNRVWDLLERALD
ncbi:MAG TPA: pentapeptide repeat-containing protein [Candidatus Limnocylindria bacterium]|nr:pentapeptide repeat-containing protein [Candidatus Limnocylindria bacterium]